MANDNSQDFSVLNNQVKWENLYLYQKFDVIYQMATVFCDRFIHLSNGRTRAQIMQTARSCKQNIVEGLVDGVGSVQIQMKVLNMARTSLKILQTDFEEYVMSRRLKFFGRPQGDISAKHFDGNMRRYNLMFAFCSSHNKLVDYEPFFQTWTDEELCNYGTMLCNMVERLMLTYMESQGKGFTPETSTKDRKRKSHVSIPADDSESSSQPDAVYMELEQQLAKAKEDAMHWKMKYEELRTRVLNSYNKQMDDIKRFKKQI